MKLLPLIVCMLLVLPNIVGAADVAQSLATLAQCSGTDCSFCNVVHLANGLIKWLIGFLFVLFAVLIAWAGAELVMSGGNRHSVDEAKSKFSNAIIGLIIILSAWLIVDTIMRGLVGGANNVGEVEQVTGWLYWSEVQCQRQIATVYDPYEPHSLEDTSVFVPYFVNGPTGSPVQVTNGANCPAALESTMMPVPGETNHKARPDIVANYVAMRAAAAIDGINLRINSSWRSEERQVELWNDANCDVACTYRVARPCSRGGNGSNHNQGEAFDLNSDHGSRELQWLQTNGGRFGFYNNLPDDRWHWSPTGG